MRNRIEAFQEHIADWLAENGVQLRAHLARGVINALALPVVVGVIVAAYDTVKLLDYLSDPAINPSSAVQVIMVVGFVIGVTFSSPGSRKKGFNAEITSAASTETDAVARQIAINDAQLVNHLPSEVQKQAMDKLFMSLVALKEGHYASELLDRRVLQTLGYADSDLGPTRRIEDARQLVQCRYAGMPSHVEWRVRVDSNHRFIRAYVECRENKDDAWLLCSTAAGQTEQIAIIKAVLIRDSMVYYKLNQRG